MESGINLNRWVVAVVGAALGLVIGIGVSLVTDVPLAPEVGVLAGGCTGYVLGRVFKGRS
jgi:hypothetical protein